MSNSNWNNIVNDYNKNKSALEAVIQSHWESFFADLYALGPYSKFGGEIGTFRPLKAGVGIVKPDIIIKDSQTNTDLFVVELKQYNYPYNADFEEQLISYMRLSGVKVGILVCQSIYVYYLYSNNNHISVKIPFVLNSAEGEAFVELFRKGNFDENNVREYINKKNELKHQIDEIKNDLSQLDIVSVLKQHYTTKYSDEAINVAFNNVTVTLNQSHTTTACVSQPTPKPHVASTTADYDYFDEPEGIDYIVIKTSEERVNQCKGSVYEATRYAWKLNVQRASTFKYVLGVIEGVVRGVYCVDEWRLVTEGECCGRYEFFGHVAPSEITNIFIGKHIPSRFCKKGMASPVLYSH